jgi:sterol 3beta-glucosyltransferase
MRITVITVGSRGDVQPYVALGLGLQAAGHDVVLVMHGVFEGFVRGRGLDFAALPGDPRAIIQSEIGQEFLSAGRNPLRALRALRRAMEQSDHRAFAACWNACQRADAVIYSLLGFVGDHIAQKLGIPAFSAVLQPLTPTREFPPLGMPAPSFPGGQLNLLYYFAAEQMAWNAFRPLVNRWRREFLHLPPLPWHAWEIRKRRHRQPVLYGYSPSIVPRPRDWPAWVHVTGYWFLDSPAAWEPPPALVDFLKAGSPPVYIGFGSTGYGDTEEAVELALRALKRSGRRGVLLSGRGIASLSHDVLMVEDVPHDWLFPQMAALVLHGSAGTTAAGLRAGVPSILAPFTGDQFLWGQRVAGLGVGPRCIPRSKLTAEHLASAIRAATSDDAMKARSTALAHRIQAEDGVTQAVEAFHMHMEGVRSMSTPPPARRFNAP